jgi:hypothetical protein
MAHRRPAGLDVCAHRRFRAQPVIIAPASGQLRVRQWLHGEHQRRRRIEVEAVAKRLFQRLAPHRSR